ncbi:MAG TPA: CvpA family protein [Casimicrobiaceae bacterium]|nr:CvpA family protein [Casimicrobiaceae bacterium]
MTGFDLAIAAIIALSALIAFFRGIVRSLIGFLAWIAGIFIGIVAAPTVATWLPAFPDYPLLPYAIAFVLIFVVAIVVGGLIAWPLHAVVHRSGLGFVDRGLGLVFGVARGALVILLFVLVGGLSPLAQRDWWQGSVLASPFEDAAIAIKPWLPQAWADRLQYPDRNNGQAGMRTV